MVQALAGIGATALGSLKTQTRRPPAPKKTRVDKTEAIAKSANIKMAKLALKNAREERLYDLISNDQVLAFALTFGSVAAAQMIPFSSNKLINESIQATMTSTSLLMGLGFAGVGDLTTALVAAAGGLASLLGNIDLPSLNMPEIPIIGDIPLVNNNDVKEFAFRSALGSIPIIGSLSPILNLIKW